MSEILSINQLIENAEKILIGVGPEFEAGMSVLEKTDLYRCFMDKLEAQGDEADYDWMFPLILMGSLSSDDVAVELKYAYRKLLNLIDGKDYFVLNMNLDPLAEYVGFDSERIVAPCGTYKKLQCDSRCSYSLYNSKDYVDGVCSLIRKEKVKLSEILQEQCDSCKDKIVPNTVNAKKYNELGYSQQWEKYQRWLMGTVNRNLLILELGTGLEYSEIIRTPFEKMATYNKKSTLVRIGKCFPFVPEKVRERSIVIQENSVNYISNI